MTCSAKTAEQGKLRGHVVDLQFSRVLKVTSQGFGAPEKKWVELLIRVFGGVGVVWKLRPEGFCGAVFVFGLQVVQRYIHEF